MTINGNTYSVYDIDLTKHTKFVTLDTYNIRQFRTSQHGLVMLTLNTHAPFSVAWTLAKHTSLLPEVMPARLRVLLADCYRPDTIWEEDSSRYFSDMYLKRYDSFISNKNRLSFYSLSSSFENFIEKQLLEAFFV
jgi:hypothetical protein